MACHTSDVQWNLLKKLIINLALDVLALLYKRVMLPTEFRPDTNFPLKANKAFFSPHEDHHITQTSIMTKVASKFTRSLSTWYLSYKNFCPQGISISRIKHIIWCCIACECHLWRQYNVRNLKNRKRGEFKSDIQHTTGEEQNYTMKKLQTSTPDFFNFSICLPFILLYCIFSFFLTE